MFISCPSSAALASLILPSLHAGAPDALPLAGDDPGMCLRCWRRIELKLAFMRSILRNLALVPGRTALKLVTFSKRRKLIKIGTIFRGLERRGGLTEEAAHAAISVSLYHNYDT